MFTVHAEDILISGFLFPSRQIAAASETKHADGREQPEETLFHSLFFPHSSLKNALELSFQEIVSEPNNYIIDYQLFHRRIELSDLKKKPEWTFIVVTFCQQRLSITCNLAQKKKKFESFRN